VGALLWRTIPDYLVLTVALYLILKWANQARAMRIALSVLALHALSLIARQFDLVITSLLLDGAALLAVVMLVVVFQPELRRAFLRLDAALHLTRRPPPPEPVDLAIASALFSLAESRTGALVVIVQTDRIGEMTDGGVDIDAAVTSSLLETIFQKNSPLHDGAVLCDSGRLTRANVILPLTQRSDVPFYFGTRHRAAMGLAERCDAIVLVVSEERGEVTAMRGREIRRMPNKEALLAWLHKLRERDERPWTAKLLDGVRTNLRLKVSAAGIASLIWILTFTSSGTTIRTLSVPIEFLNVPPGMDIDEDVGGRLAVELRGRSWLLESASISGTVARFDLARAKPGTMTLPITSSNLNLPPGIEIDSVTPPNLRLRITPRRQAVEAPR
jgi:diadenylate cyclase